MADLLVLGGCTAIEQAAEKAGFKKVVPFLQGRTDATQEQTDISSFALLEPKADGFINYVKYPDMLRPEEHLIDKAQLLKLTAPEMTALIGGMRVLDTNFGHAPFGVLTKQPGVLSNDFFVNMLDMGIEWKPMNENKSIFEGIERSTKQRQWMASRVDLIFGSNSQLRAFCEVYASDDSQEKFINDFINVWHKVMMSDRFDVNTHR